MVSCPNNQAEIGIFDSGLGGLSVLRHIRAQLPSEALHYFADSGFAPYGDKTEEEVAQRTLLVAHYLVQQGVKAMVVACNTATSVTIQLLRSIYPELILVGVEPGLKPAANISKTGYVGVLATSRTLASQKYQLLAEQIQQESKVRFIHQACPGLATQIERGELEGPTTLQLLNGYLQPILATPADTIVLGCTHYPFLENSIRRLIGNRSVQLIDTGVAIANQLQRQLTTHRLINLHGAPQPIRYTTSGDTHRFKLALTQLLGEQPENHLITTFAIEKTTEKEVAIQRQAN